MKKIDIHKHKKYKNIDETKIQKYILKNPKKIFRKNSGEKIFNNTAFYNYSNPYLNNSFNKFELKENSKIDVPKERIISPKKIFTKINTYKSKMSNTRPQSSTGKQLPILLNSNIFPGFSPSNYLSLETEKLNQEKIQLNKLIKKLKTELYFLKKENEEKDELLNNKEEEINKIIINNNMIFGEEQNEKIKEKKNVGIEDNTLQNNSAYNLYLKIKKEINNFNNEIKEEEDKIKRLKHSIYYTKMYENNIESNVLEDHINQINSLMNSALKTREINGEKLKELYNINYKINIQKNIINELGKKQKYLYEDKDYLENEIKTIKNNLTNKKDQVIKNKKEIITLKKKNYNLTNDQVIKSQVYIHKNNNSQISVNSLYLQKITELKKIIYFYKNQNKYNESVIEKLKTQKKSLLESIKLAENIKYSSSFLSLKLNNNNNKTNDKNKENENINKEESNVNEKENTSNDEEKINQLRIRYKKVKDEEKRLEEKYKECQQKIKQLNEYIIQQNMNNENNNEGNIDDEKGQNQIEFGIDENNPYYTDNEDNQPDVHNKFTTSQFNQFTYILFKNFEAKNIVSDESKNKIIVPFIKLADDNKLNMVQYPSDQFDFVSEEYTKIILNSINSENNYNHLLTKIFVSALLFNSGCLIQKLVEYFNILFSYTRNYINEEEKYLDKLRNKYKEEIKNLIICINNYLENDKKEKKYEMFPTYFPLIKIKELIEKNNITLKDKYVEFLFYYLKKFNDNQAKLDELKYSLLNDILNDKNIKINENKEEENKQEKNDINTNNIINDKKENNENITNANNIEDGNKDNNDNQNNEDNTNKENKEKNNDKEFIENINDNNNIEEDKTKNINTEKKSENNSKLEDSMTEITNDEYIKQLNDAIKLIKNGLKKKKFNFKDFIRDIKQNIEIENNIIECFTIDDFNEKLKRIGVVFSDLKLSCLCSKYSLPNELRLIEVKKLEEDIN